MGMLVGKESTAVARWAPRLGVGGGKTHRGVGVTEQRGPIVQAPQQLIPK